MTSATELILIRHGVTSWNKAGRFQGDLDVELSDAGHQQASLTAQRLADTPIAAIYSSDLSRAMMTATPIALRQGLTIVPEPLLRERRYGAFQGQTSSEIAERDPQAYGRWRARDPAFEPPGGGESLTAVMERARSVLDRLAQRHLGETVVVVTHGGVLDCLYRIASGLTLSAPRGYDLLNASLNTITWDGRRYAIHQWADVEHLEGSVDDR